MNLLIGTLTLGRKQANARMTETVTVTTETPGNPDPVTLAPTTNVVAVYTGPARIKYVVTRVLERETASQLPAAQDLEVHFPSGTTGIKTDQFVTVTSSTADVGAVGQRYRIRGFGQGGQTTALRFPVEEVS